jgi:hypothetical protein
MQCGSSFKTSMKVFNALSLLATSVAVSAHCTDISRHDKYEIDRSLYVADTFPDLIANGTTSTDWRYVRMTQNYQSNGPVGFKGLILRLYP